MHAYVCTVITEAMIHVRGLEFHFIVIVANKRNYGLYILLLCPLTVRVFIFEGLNF